MIKVEKYWENPEILHINCESPRAYFIPYSCKEKAEEGNRNNSEYFLSLCGKWKFRFYESVNKIKEEFYREKFKAGKWDEIDVPSNWQLYEYDKP